MIKCELDNDWPTIIDNIFNNADNNGKSKS